MLKRNISSGRKRFRRVRRECGASLVELMVAIMISGIIMVALGSSLSEQMRLGTKTQNQLVAAELAKTLSERIRATKFDDLPTYLTPQNVRIAAGDLNDTHSYTGEILSRPLQIDGQLLQYKSPSSDNPMPISKFPGEVTLTLGGMADGPSGPLDDTRKATILVTWMEPGQSDSKRLELKMILYRNGIQVDR